MFDQIFKKHAPLMVGIDIGSHCIKAVLLAESSAGFRVEAVAIEPLPKGAMKERAIQDIEAIGRIISKTKKTSTKRHTVRFGCGIWANSYHQNDFYGCVFNRC